MTKWYYTHTISWVPHRIPFLHDYVRNYDKNSGWYWWDSYVKAWQTTHSQVLAALRNIHLQRCHWGPCKVSLLIELTQYHTVSHTVKDQSEEHLSNTCALSYIYIASSTDILLHALYYNHDNATILTRGKESNTNYYYNNTIWSGYVNDVNKNHSP